MTQPGGLRPDTEGMYAKATLIVIVVSALISPKAAEAATLAATAITL